MKYRSLLLFVMLLLSVGMPALAQEEMAAADLRIGALPVLNMLPLYVAQDAGYFDEAGIVVEIVDFPSGAAAQQAAIAGEIDGFQADVVSALKVNAGGGDVRVVRHVGITNVPFISIMAGRASGIERIDDLAGSTIGLSRNTIIQYMTDTLLASAGLDPDEVEYVDVPGIWDRTQRVAEVGIDAATLPYPFTLLAFQFGATVLIDDSKVAYVPESLNIRAEVLTEKGEAVRAFLAAYERAVDTINAWEGDNSAYEAFLEGNDRGGAQALKSAMTSGGASVPTLTRSRVPSEAEYREVHDWALEAGVLVEAQAFADVVDGQFLPEVIEEDVAEADVMAEEAAAAVTEARQEIRGPDLRIGISPSINTLPLYVARDAGYFEEEGLAVELVESTSELHVQAAMEAEEFDGLQLRSLIRMMELNVGAGRVSVVREVEVTNLPYFAILAIPGSGIESMEDLTSTPIAILGGSESEFLAGQLIESAGLDVDQVEFAYIDPSDLGVLTDQVMAGRIKVVFVDALHAQIASLWGAGSSSILIDSDETNYSGAQELIGFRAEVLEEKGEAVRAFLRAYERAEEALNALEGNTQAYRQLVATMSVDQDAIVTSIVFAGVGPVPMFAPPGVPSAEEIAPVQEWALSIGLLDASIAYDALVDGRFLMEVMAEE